MQEDQKIILGCHVMKKWGKIDDVLSELDKACKSHTKSQLGVIQMYVSIPYQSEFKSTLKNKDIDAISQFPSLQLYAHTAYTNKPFSISSQVRKDSVTRVLKELEVVDDIKMNGLVVHLPMGVKPETVDSLVTASGNSKIYFENEVQRDYTLAEFSKIINSLSEKSKNYGKYGFVIDPSHAGIGGDDMLANEKYIEDFLHSLPVADYILHLNDKHGRAHSSFAHGDIWSNKNNWGTLKLFINFAITKQIPIIIERKAMLDVIEDFKIIGSILRGE